MPAAGPTGSACFSEVGDSCGCMRHSPLAFHMNCRLQGKSLIERQVSLPSDGQNRSGMLVNAIRAGAAAPASPMLAENRVAVPYFWFNAI